MDKKVVIASLFVLIVAFFGCTISVNPQDLSPSKNYALTQNNDSNLSSSGVDKNVSNSTTTSITLSASEVKKHTTVNDCWMIINSKVYDLSQYVGHPGGDIYVPYCGTDGTKGYDTKGGGRGMHSSYADALLANYLIGSVGQTVVSTVQSNSNSTSSGVSSTTQGTNSTTSQNNSQQEYEWDD